MIMSYFSMLSMNNWTKFYVDFEFYAIKHTDFTLRFLTFSIN